MNLKVDNGCDCGADTAGINAAPSHEATSRILRAALATADGWWEWDLTTGTAWYSDEFAELLGFELLDLQPAVSTWYELIHPQDRPAVVSAVDSHIMGGPPFDVQFRLRTRSGEFRWYRSRGKCFEVDGERRQLISGNLQDIHSHKLLAKQGETQAQALIEQQRMDSLNTMAGGVAHEFNNLLQVMQGYVQAAMRTSRLGGDALADLHQAQGAIDRAIKLNREFLSFCRTGVSEAVLVDLNVTVAALAERLRPVLPPDIRLVTLGSKTPMLVGVREGALHEALLNLATNARDAMPAGGELTVHGYTLVIDERNERLFPCLNRGHYACLAVTDTGEGIDPKSLHRVWEPFYTTKDPSRGSGLGLAQVYSFAHQHQGTVGVHSRPRQGTTIRIYLPLAKEVERRHVTEDRAGEPMPQTVVLYTNDPTLGDALQRLMGPAGGEVVFIDCSALLWDTIERCGKEKVWVLLDCDDYQEMGCALRARWPKLSLACLTGFDPVSALSPARIGDADQRWSGAVIEKPFDSEAIRRVLQEGDAAAELPLELEVR